MENTIDFYKTRGVGETVNTTISFIRENLKPLFRSIFFIAGPAIFAGSILMGILQSNMLTLSSSLAKNGPTGLAFSNMMSYGIWGFAFSLLSFFLIVSVVYEYLQLYESNKSGSIELKEVWKGIKKDWWFILKTIIGLFFTFFVVFFVIWLVMLIIIGVGAATGALSGLFGGNVGNIIGAILGIAMIFGVFMVMLYMLSPLTLIFNIRIFERKKFFASLSRSYQLISGKRWKTVGLLFICLVIQVMFSFLFYIPTILSMAFTQFSLTVVNYSWLAVVFYVVIMILGSVIHIVSMVALNFHYFSIVEEKEAVSLKRKVALFGSGNSPEPVNA